MKVSTENMVSIVDVNQNFMKVAGIVDHKGAALILKNNMPRYVMLDYQRLQSMENASDEEILELGKRVLSGAAEIA